MKSYFKLGFGPRTGALLGAAAAVCISGAALAITDTAYNYTTAKTGYYGISSFAVSPASSDAQYMSSVAGGVTTSGSLYCFQTGVNLPNGAIIKTLVVYYSGIDEGDIGVALRRHSNTNGAINMIGEKSSMDASGTRKNLPVTLDDTYTTVNNAQFNYSFEVCVDPGGAFFGARVGYTYTNAGD